MKNMKPIHAIAVFDTKKIKGTVKFSEDFENKKIIIEINISGLKPNVLQGMHIYETGDLSDNFDNLGGHFNPYGKKHGCPGMTHRHVGDLDNIITDNKGVARYFFDDDVIKLRGTKANIIGRALVIHENKDDHGKGDNEESKKTGNSGKIIACAIIGYSKENYKL